MGFKRESREQPRVKCGGQDDGPKATFDKMCKLFVNAHAIDTQNHIHTLWMCTLDDMKGVQIGNTYRNDSSVQRLSITLLRHKGMKSKRWLPRQSLYPSSAMVQLTTATTRPNWHMFGTVTKGQSMSTLLG